MFDDNAKFPEDISYGSVSTPQYSTRVITSASGYRSKNSNWDESLYAGDISYGIRSQDQLTDVLNFFHSQKGSAIGFRFKDWSDYKSLGPEDPVDYTDVVLLESAIGGETTVQLIKNYKIGSFETVKTIKKPVSGTVRLGKNGAEIFEGSDWSLDYTTGLVTLNVALVVTDRITAGYEWDLPVNFAEDSLPINLEFFEGGGTGIMVIEDRSA